MSELYWHCRSCGAHERVTPTGDAHEYEIGDKEPCITCENGTAEVMTVKMAAMLEQKLALRRSSTS